MTTGELLGVIQFSRYHLNEENTWSDCLPEEFLLFVVKSRRHFQEEYMSLNFWINVWINALMFASLFSYIFYNDIEIIVYYYCKFSDSLKDVLSF